MLTLLLIAAVLFGAVGQFFDAYTTYIGVTVKKIAVEGNKAAAWLVAHPWLSFLVKTGGPLLSGALALFALPYVAPSHSDLIAVRVIVTALEIALGIFGGKAALANNKINNAKR